jgi:hypothetical protein
MGLNFDATSVTGSKYVTAQEVELRRQIYWALYCTDKLHASYSGRVCTMLVCIGRFAARFSIRVFQELEH